MKITLSLIILFFSLGLSLHPINLNQAHAEESVMNHDDPNLADNSGGASQSEAGVKELGISNGKASDDCDCKKSPSGIRAATVPGATGSDISGPERGGTK